MVQFGGGDIGHGGDPDIDQQGEEWDEASLSYVGGPARRKSLEAAQQDYIDGLKLYEVQVSGVTADKMAESIDWFIERESPIKFYAKFTDHEAVMYAQDNDFIVTRAPADWKL